MTNLPHTSDVRVRAVMEPAVSEDDVPIENDRLRLFLQWHRRMKEERAPYETTKYDYRAF